MQKNDETTYKWEIRWRKMMPKMINKMMHNIMHNMINIKQKMMHKITKENNDAWHDTKKWCIKWWVRWWLWICECEQDDDICARLPHTSILPRKLIKGTIWNHTSSDWSMAHVCRFRKSSPSSSNNFVWQEVQQITAVQTLQSTTFFWITCYLGQWYCNSSRTWNVRPFGNDSPY